MNPTASFSHEPLEARLEGVRAYGWVGKGGREGGREDIGETLSLLHIRRDT